MVWEMVDKETIVSKRIAVLIVYDDNYESMKNLTVDHNIKNYCELHGYTLIEHKTELTERTPHWSKISESIKILKSNNFDWVFFIDLDCLIMNTTIKLETIIDDNYSFIVPSHGIPSIDNPIVTPFNTDNIISSQFLVKNDEFGVKILEDIWGDEESLQNPIINTFDYEGRQTRLTILKDEFKPHIKIIEEKILNRFWYMNSPFMVFYNVGINDLVWQPGDFIVHVTGYKQEERIRILSDLNFFSGGEIINLTFKDEKIYFSSFSHLPYILIKIKDLNDNIINEFEFTELNPKYKYFISPPQQIIDTTIRIEGYDKNNNLISLFKLKL
jgi:mannan polymerase II complex MNN10 subunit